MDERSPKRRRVTGSPSAGEQEQRRTPRRASFMSPTKASLARFNPNLLKSPYLSTSPRRPQSRRGSIAPTSHHGPEAQGSEDLTTAHHEITNITSNETDAGASGTMNLFHDLDLNTDNAAPAVPDRNREPVPQSPSHDITSEGEYLRGGDDEASMRLAKAKEKEDITKELQSLRRSCKQLEQFLERTKTGSAEMSMDNTSIRKLAALMDEEDDSRQESEAQPMSTLMNTFLPFTTPQIQQPADVDEEVDIPSHRPLELKDPLPCLQLFTGLRSALHTEPPRTDRDVKGHVSSRQTQRLQLSDPNRLFAANIRFEVCTSANDDAAPKIMNLSVLDLSHWARSELSPWIRQREDDCDLNCLTYGLGSYYEMSMRRAEVWLRCEKQFSNLLRHESEGEKENSDQAGTSQAGTWTKLHPQMARSSLLLMDKEVMLRVTWNIRMDWTGDAESEVVASASFSQTCTFSSSYEAHWMLTKCVDRELDTRKSLAKVPVTFGRLVKDRGVFAAINAMVSVLFS